MGAWGAGPFDNDDAADWVTVFERDPTGETVRAALAIDGDHYLDLPEGSAAVAAEVVAASLGQPGGYLPDTVAVWASEHGGELGAADAALSLAALDAVVGDQSALRGLWAEDPPDARWLESVADLRRRLTLARA